MICTAPNLHSLSQPALSEPAPDEPLAVHYGFILDGVESLANITTSEAGFHMFLVYPDPKFEEFEGGMKQFFSSKNEYLTINVSASSCVQFISILEIVKNQCLS